MEKRDRGGWQTAELDDGLSRLCRTARAALPGVRTEEGLKLHVSGLFAYIFRRQDFDVDSFRL